MLDRDSSIPLYQQLEDVLLERIRGGEWAPNQRIPSENELNRMFGLSRMTVRGVLTKLVEDGLLFRVAGKGTYVQASKISAVSPAYRGVREQLEAMGYATSTELLSAELVVPSSTVRERLHLERTDQVHAISRLRSVEGEPLSVHRSFVPARLAPDLTAHDLVGGQLCVVLDENYGLPMASVEEHLEAVAADTADARLLGLRRGAPVLRLTDVIHGRDGAPFEYSTVTFRGDTMRLRFDYRL